MQKTISVKKIEFKHFNSTYILYIIISLYYEWIKQFYNTIYYNLENYTL